MAQVNQELKLQLFRQIETIGTGKSLFPFAEPEIDQTIRQLEQISPIAQPLAKNNLDGLMGEWQLVYASNGTVITRPLAEATKVIGSGIKLRRVWQSLNILNGEIKARNQALIELILWGEYQLTAEGIWKIESDKRTAQVAFNAFAIQATKFWGQPSWTFPEVKIPAINFLQNEALWITSYLDEDIRIGRGSTGNLFVFTAKQIFDE